MNKPALRPFVLAIALAVLAVGLLPSTAFPASKFASARNSSGTRTCGSTVYYSSAPGGYYVSSVVSAETASTGVMTRYINISVYNLGVGAGVKGILRILFETNSPVKNVSAMSYTFYPKVVVAKQPGDWQGTVQNGFYANGAKLTTYVRF